MGPTPLCLRPRALLIWFRQSTCQICDCYSFTIMDVLLEKAKYSFRYLLRIILMLFRIPSCLCFFKVLHCYERKRRQKQIKPMHFLSPTHLSRSFIRSIRIEAPVLDLFENCIDCISYLLRKINSFSIFIIIFIIVSFHAKEGSDTFHRGLLEVIPKIVKQRPPNMFPCIRRGLLDFRGVCWRSTQ